MKTIALIGCAAAIGFGACGDDARDDGSASAKSPRDRALDGALAFARCMREQGVDLPDPKPGANGMVQIGPGPGGGDASLPGPADPAFRRAEPKCRKHLDAGIAGPDGAAMAEHRDAFVAYARCMRAEGVDHPDPDPDDGFRFRIGDPDAPNPRSPEYQRADKACHKHLAEVDEAMGVGAPE